MAKYLVDETRQCIVFAMPGARQIIRCAISFATLTESFGEARLTAMGAFLRNRTEIERIAAELILAARPPDADGWIWLSSADCQSGGTTSACDGTDLKP